MPRKVFFFHPGALRPASSTDGALLFYVFPSLFASLLSLFFPFFSPSFAAGPSAAVCKPARPLPSPTSFRLLGASFLVREETLIITWQLLSRGKSLVWVP